MPLGKRYHDAMGNPIPDAPARIEKIMDDFAEKAHQIFEQDVTSYFPMDASKRPIVGTVRVLINWFETEPLIRQGIMPWPPPRVLQKLRDDLEFRVGQVFDFVKFVNNLSPGSTGLKKSAHGALQDGTYYVDVFFRTRAAMQVFQEAIPVMNRVSELEWDEGDVFSVQVMPSRTYGLDG